MAVFMLVLIGFQKKKKKVWGGEKKEGRKKKKSPKSRHNSSCNMYRCNFRNGEGVKQKR